MLGTHTLDCVSKKTTSPRPRYSREIAARRTQLDKSGTDIDEETRSVIYPKLLSRLETGIKDPGSLTVKQLSALLASLQWSPREFYEATGVAVPGSRDVPTKIVSSSPAKRSTRPLPTYRLIVTHNKGEVVKEDKETHFDSDREGEYDAYVLETEEGGTWEFIVRRQSHAREGHEVICDLPNRGTLYAKIMLIEGGVYVLQDLTKSPLEPPIGSSQIRIRGVIVRKQKDVEEPPASAN